MSPRMIHSEFKPHVAYKCFFFFPNLNLSKPDQFTVLCYYNLMSCFYSLSFFHSFSPLTSGGMGNLNPGSSNVGDQAVSLKS